MNKKLLGFALSTIFLAMLATPMVSAKPTIKTVTFRVESWPAGPTFDWSKFKMFPAGVSGNFKLMKLPAYGSPDYLGGLIGYIPDQANLGEWGPLLFASAGGVSLSIQGEAEPRIGTVTQKVVKSNTFADGSVIAAEKWTLTFDDGTLEVSSNHGKDGMGLCVGTKGTGYFEGAKFSGTYVATMTPYDLTPFGMEGTAIFKVQLGTGELMLKP